MSMNSLLFQMLAARTGGGNPAVAEILARISSPGGTSVPDPQQLLAQLGDSNPLISALGKHFSEKSNDFLRPTQPVIDVEPVPATQEMEPAEESWEEKASKVTEEVKKLSAELKILRDRNDLLAAALGACCLCWGQDADCRFCRGRGKPGFAAPDETHISEFVLPAIHMLRVQRAKNHSSSPPANSAAKETSA